LIFGYLHTRTILKGANRFRRGSKCLCKCMFCCVSDDFKRNHVYSLNSLTGMPAFSVLILYKTIYALSSFFLHLVFTEFLSIFSKSENRVLASLTNSTNLIFHQ